MQEEKLKTLRDLPSVTELPLYEEAIERKTLKAEAVKWVKHIQTMKLPKSRTGVAFETTKWRREEYNQQIQWIIHFFNLTEADLK